MRARCDWPGTWNVCGARQSFTRLPIHIIVITNQHHVLSTAALGGSGVEEVFRQSSDISPMKVAGGNGGTEQW